jgi:hypothetical protein
MPTPEVCPHVDRLLEEFPDKPHVSKRVHNGALQHSLDGARPDSRTIMLVDWTVINCSGSQCLPMHGDWVINEEFYPDSGESGGGWRPRPVLRRLIRQEKLGAIYRQARNGTAFHLP